MVLLSRTNEITAMSAVGMGPLKVGLPVALGGAVLTFTSVFFGEVVLPISSKSIHYIQDVQIEKMSSSEVNQEGKWRRNGSVLYNFKDYDSLAGVLRGVSVFYTASKFAPKRILKIDTATFNKDSQIWTGAKVDSYEYRSGNLLSLKQYKNKVVDLPFSPDKLVVDRRFLTSYLSLIFQKRFIWVRFLVLMFCLSKLNFM